MGRPKQYSYAPKICGVCEIVFNRPENVKGSQWDKRRFCGNSCATKHKHITGKLKKSPETIAKISAIKKAQNLTQEKSHRWKGKKAGYFAIHSWLSRNWNKTGICETCNRPDRTQWANLDGKYNREDRETWMELCPACHMLRDRRPEWIVISGEKTCPRCNETKPRVEFGRNKARIDCCQVYCLECSKDYHMKRRRARDHIQTSHPL